VAFLALQLVLRMIDSRKNTERAQTLINAAYEKQASRIDSLTRDLELAKVRAKEAEALTHEMATRLNTLSADLEAEREARDIQERAIAHLKEQVTTLKASVETHDRDKQAAEAQRDAATRKNAELEAALGTAQTRIGELEKRVLHLEALIDAKDKALEAVAVKIGEAIERAVKPQPAVDGTATEPAGA
jgi:chromosome segregation ATPase